MDGLATVVTGSILPTPYGAALEGAGELPGAKRFCLILAFTPGLQHGG